MSSYHIDRSRWRRLTLIEQMANIGSEVDRTITAIQRGDRDRSQHALVRALDLFDATVEQLITQHSYRVKEVLRAKEDFLTAISEHENTAHMNAVDRYFLQYGIAARLSRSS